MNPTDPRTQPVDRLGTARARTLLMVLTMFATALVSFSAVSTPAAAVDSAGYGKPAGPGGFEPAERSGRQVRVVPDPKPDPVPGGSGSGGSGSGGSGSGGSCSAPVPAGTTFGSSIYPVGISSQEALRQNDDRFGKLPIVRDFFPGLPPTWGSGRAKLLSDREIIISFKATPQVILSGKHDAFFRNWFATAPTDQVIYWSYHHEPEGQVKRGDFTKAQYRAAWARLGGFAAQVCKPNMHATLILSDWVMHPLSGESYLDYDPGNGVVDVLAFDPYNKIFEANSTVYDTPAKMLGNIVTAMKKDGRPFGLAELGSRIMQNDPNGSRRAQWLRDVGNYAIDNGFSFVSYFQSTVGADWRLLDANSSSMWRSFVGSSPR